MFGTDFKFLERKNPKKKKLFVLENKRNRIWDEYLLACSEGIECGINYESELKKLTDKIENLKWEIKNGY